MTTFFGIETLNAKSTLESVRTEDNADASPRPAEGLGPAVSVTYWVEVSA